MKTEDSKANTLIIELFMEMDDDDALLNSKHSIDDHDKQQQQQLSRFWIPDNDFNCDYWRLSHDEAPAFRFHTNINDKIILFLSYFELFHTMMMRHPLPPLHIISLSIKVISFAA